MDFNLNNKVALITGSSKGIGLEIAKTLDKEGCQVIINGRNEKTLKQAMKKLPSAMPIIGDVTKSEDTNRLVQKIISTYGKLDIVVCNVGSGKSVPHGKENHQEWLKSYSINFLSTTNIIEATKDEMEKSKGNYLCISSICGVETILEAPITYSTSKAALNSFVKGVSKPFGSKGIRINAIAPGNILFEGSVWDRKMNTNPDETQKLILKEVALGTLGKTQDIANMAAFLVSPLANFITGSIVIVDGGQIRS